MGDPIWMSIPPILSFIDEVQFYCIQHIQIVPDAYPNAISRWVRLIITKDKIIMENQWVSDKTHSQRQTNASLIIKETPCLFFDAQ